MLKMRVGIKTNEDFWTGPIENKKDSKYFCLILNFTDFVSLDICFNFWS